MAGWMRPKGLPTPHQEESRIVKEYRDRHPQSNRTPKEILQLNKAKREVQAQAFVGTIIGEPFTSLSNAAWSFLNDFANRNGLNERHVEYIAGILRGKRGPKVDFTKVYHEWATAQEKVLPAKNKRQAINKLRLHYENLDRQIESDPTFLPRFKKVWKAQYTVIQCALDDLKDCTITPMDILKPHAPFTVGLDKELSRQGFWTPLIIALVKIWDNIGLTHYRAYKDIAGLLSAAFPRIDEPEKPTFTHHLVKRRFLHAPKNLAE